MANLMLTAKKLMKALNGKGYMLTMSNKEFMGKEGKVHNFYSINNAVWNADKGKYDHFELYSSPAPLRIVFYLRDMWFTVNGQELPTDDEKWNSIRETLKDKEGYNGQYGKRSL